MEENCGILFNNLPIACLLLQPVGENFFVRDVNEEYCRIFKKERQDLLNLPVQQIFHYKPVQHEIIIASLHETLLNQKPVTFDYINYCNDNTEKESFWEISNIPIKDSSEKKISYILHLPSNKTSKVREERNRLSIVKELEEKKAQNECFVYKSQDGLFSLDAKGNFLSVNKGIVDFAEVSAEQLLKMSFLSFCREQYRDKIFNFFIRALGGEDQNCEAVFVSSKGRTVVLDVSLVPMKIHGEIVGVYGIARDITEKKQSEKTIREQQEKLMCSENKFKALVQKSSDLTGILDLKGNYKFVSESTISILGISPEEFIGKNFSDYIHPDDKEAVMTYFVQIEDKKQLNIPIFRFRDLGSNWRWLKTTVTNLTDNPYVQGIVTNSRDITESKHLWDETLKKNKILNEIAWEHAHIVRSPLVRLRGLIDLLEEENYEIWNREDLIKLIKASAEELDRTVLATVRKIENVENREPN
ncbi:PAS domain S-box protein [Salinimicrobium sp. WS361]|uniref:PAS domain S-box protein n=1 Tax=Salinimicrobium sp. WS361 TaxID=3425123 RepID=UPI003D6FA1F3